MEQTFSIAVLTCWYGSFPWYFRYFINSCSFNPTIDFYIITNNDATILNQPPNVKIVLKSLDDVKNLASSRLGFTVNIDHVYKLCDFKPAFGFIFNDIVKGYAFWGYGDIDIVYGNIRNFMTDDILKNFEVISVRHDWLTGCFALFKNIAKINTLFLKSKDHQKVLSSPEHYCFDETNFCHNAFTEGKRYDAIPSEIESMTHVVKKMGHAGYIKPYFDLHIIEGGVPGRLTWDSGTLTYKNSFEVMMYHLIKFKNVYQPLKYPKRIPALYRISPTRIY